jgi:hypothetical protein
MILSFERRALVMGAPVVCAAWGAGTAEKVSTGFACVGCVAAKKAGTEAGAGALVVETMPSIAPYGLLITSFYFLYFLLYRQNRSTI